ncbi:MAG: LysR family transcriptional regulator [Bacillus sp. (in: firmicutes)]
MNTLGKLETLIVLAECRSFTEAAQRLFCSQPTVSHHINSLEGEFGCKLLHRKGKNVVFTKQGGILLDYARRISKLMEEATLEMKKADDLNRILSIYVSDYFSKYYLPKIMPAYLQGANQQLYEINCYCYGDLKRCLQEEETNFAIMPIYPGDTFLKDGFESTILFEEELALVVPANHRFSSRKVLFCRDLQNEIVLLPKSYYLQQEIIEQLREHNIKVNYLQMSNFELMVNGIKSGLGIAFLPYSVVETAVERGEVAVRQISAFRISRKNGLVIRKNVQLSNEEKAFTEVVKEQFTSYIMNGVHAANR